MATLRSTSRRNRLNILAALASLAFLLSGCDPTNPTGVRFLAVVPTESGSIYAFAPIFGIGSQYRAYQSTDGGYSWKWIISGSEISSAISNLWQQVSKDVPLCSNSCEFGDAYDATLKYRIRPGKYLESSKDDGKTWKVELYMPAWTWMERSYITSHYYEPTGPWVRDVRGPFHAITDPATGNLIVSMGFEGIMVRRPGSEWEWIRVDTFSKVQPTRLEMLGEIDSQEWWRGLLIALFLFLVGLRRCGFHTLRKSYLFVNWAALLMIVIPKAGIIFAFIMAIFGFDSLLGNIPDDVLIALLPTMIIGAQILLSVMGILSLGRDIRRNLLRVYILAFLGLMLYWLMFVLWSQGALPTYEVALVLGFAAALIMLFLVWYTTKTARNDDQPVKPREVPWDTSSL